mgnify:CR=1 FL=1
MERKGLTKLEIELFLQKFRNHRADLSDNIINDIIQFRAKTTDVSNEDKKNYSRIPRTYLLRY